MSGRSRRHAEVAITVDPRRREQRRAQRRRLGRRGK